MIRYVLLAMVTVGAVALAAQENAFIDKYAMSYQQGSVFSTNAFLRGNNNEREAIKEIWSASLSLGKQTTGKAYWQQNYLYPYIGAGIFTVSFGEASKELGKPVALYGFFSAPFLRKKKSSIDYEIRLGLAFNWKPFSPLNNPNNISIGSGTTVYIDLGASYAFHLSDELVSEVGVSISHFSNGALKKPNFGINAYAPKLSMVYQLKRLKMDFTNPTEAPKIEGYEWNAGFFMGSTNIVFDSLSLDIVEKYEGVNFPTFGFATSFNRRVGRKSKFGLGLSLDYHTYYHAAVSVINNEIEKSGPITSNRFALSIFPSYELVIDRVSIILQPAYYIYRAKLNDNNPRLYQRLGIKYYLKNGVYLGANLRAFNYHVSDFIEWNIGYRIEWD